MFRSDSSVCKLLTRLVVLAGIGLVPGTVIATPYWETVVDNAAVVIDTALLNLTAVQEKEMIRDNWEEWARQREDEGKKSVGQAAKDGSYPVNDYKLADVGNTEILTYFFIDPATGLKTTPAFEVFSVRYEALLEPPTLNKDELSEALIRDSLTFLGTSFEITDDFALEFTLQGFEPMILAFPFDATGNEITGEGTAAFASNVLVPEPATLALLSIGLAGLGFTRRITA